MNVNKWGPAGWELLHSMAFNYPLEPMDENKKIYSNFFKSIGDILPCKYCRESYNIYYKYIPIDDFLDSREGVSYWLYRIHQLINEKIFKNNIPFEDVVIKYENMRAKCGKLTRDNDLDKKYKTCQLKTKSIDKIYLNKFITKSESYKKKIDDMVDKLYKSDENPNKECLEIIKKKNKENILKMKIYYSL